jgi:hypothetical protein
MQWKQTRGYISEIPLRVPASHPLRVIDERIHSFGLSVTAEYSDRHTENCR